MADVNQKIFWSDNLKFLRTRKKLSQDQVAEKLGIKRPKLNAHENGITKNPPLEDLLIFSAFYQIAVDTLLKIDLSKISELKLRELEAGNDIYITGGKLRVLAITVNSSNKENIEYVPAKAKAGYKDGCKDPEYIAELPKGNLPNLPGTGTFRMFPTTGDSMLPIPEGSDIIGKYVEVWTQLKANTPCIVILKDQDFVFKMVTVQDNGTFILTSSNPVYEPYRVEAADVLEIWAYHSFHSKRIPEYFVIRNLISK